jgi:hypothetical protein
VAGRFSELTIASQPSEQAAMKGVRKEERNSEKLQVLLGSTADSLAVESAFDGKRQFSRPARANATALESGHSPDHPIFRKRAWARARIVYCEALEDSTFAIGLELLVAAMSCPRFFGRE